MGKIKPTVGISFFNIRTNEKASVTRPAQIRAYIESSDMGKNRQSDMGWRLGADWVIRLEKARQNKPLIVELAKNYGGQLEDVDLLIELYNREVMAEKYANTSTEVNKYEKDYQESIKALREAANKPLKNNK